MLRRIKKKNSFIREILRYPHVYIYIYIQGVSTRPTKLQEVLERTEMTGNNIAMQGGIEIAVVVNYGKKQFCQ